MSDALVFVTGSTGFIGSHVVAAILKAGYRVRLSIRRAEQEATLRQYFPEFNDKIETCIVSDITQRDSFHEALQGVDYVFHIASPMPGKGTDFQNDYIDPAVNGTESILYAALEFPQIKKVVIESSILALVPPASGFSSSEISVKDNTGEIIPVDTNMTMPEGSAGHWLKYASSKILAHQATRAFLQNNKPHYALITFHPAFVLGDSMIQKTAQDIDAINGFFWESLESRKPNIPTAWVHVRDVADAHVKALETEIESGTEFLLATPVVSWEYVGNYVKSKYPTVHWKLEPPFGSWTVDVSTADRILRLKWRSQEQIVDDVINQQLALRAKASI
ncbi:hypothetical protein BDV28DRAFT_146949 [Aspergillus coremiiformis]|uniref:NAD-dependent epimerase/dehydratase domain-containing protein n=1 Tax=Aspergillus coremiiformis TaxID=138285 RepID=A0A5N6ZES2_9EURO|nr:hypothetical protein BDV28DRAFT_146949 [Aspergillus coremiiformis]